MVKKEIIIWKYDEFIRIKIPVSFWERVIIMFKVLFSYNDINIEIKNYSMTTYNLGNKEYDN